jgi:hypothetical protein
VLVRKKVLSLQHDIGKVKKENEQHYKDDCRQDQKKPILDSIDIICFMDVHRYLSPSVLRD